MRRFLTFAFLLSLASCSVGRLAFELEILEPKEDGVSNVPIPGAFVHLIDSSTQFSTEGFTDVTGFVNLELTVTDDETHQFVITIEKTGFQKTVQIIDGDRKAGISKRFFISKAE